MCYEVRKENDSWYRIYEKNVYMELLIGTQKALLIDTGFGGGALPAEVRKLTDNPLVVVNTHDHPDHNGGNAQFEKVHTLQEGQKLCLGGLTVTAVATPGHTQNGMSYLWEEKKLLFVGDAANPFLWLFGLGATTRQDVLDTYDKIAALDIVGFMGAHAPVMLTMEDLNRYRRAVVEADWEKGIPFDPGIPGVTDVRVCPIDGFGAFDFDKPGFASIVLGKDY